MTNPHLTPIQAAQVEFDSSILAKLLKGEPHIRLSLHPSELVAVIAHVQLTLRHPLVKEQFGVAAEIAETTIRKWIKKLPVAAQGYLEAGFNPDHDLPTKG